MIGWEGSLREHVAKPKSQGRTDGAESLPNNSVFTETRVKMFL